MKKVVVIGGGTGTFVVLSGLKNYHLDLSVIVSMMDSGGSTGRLRDQLGVLPPGDVRQCLVALSSSTDLWRKLFLYRFEKGDLKGHNFGNIIISALEKISSNYNEVVDYASEILNTTGRVIPVTLDKANLIVEYENGKTIKTEGMVDSIKIKSKVKRLYLKPLVNANEKAVNAIHKADFLILGPGDLYTSIIPNLVVNGVSKSIKVTEAKIIYIVNLMTKLGQTTNYKASDHVYDLEKYLGRKVDFIVMNNSLISNHLKRKYMAEGEQEVDDNLKNDKRVIRADLLSTYVFENAKGDKLKRSLIRHDYYKLARVLNEIISSGGSIRQGIKDILGEAKVLVFE